MSASQAQQHIGTAQLNPHNVLLHMGLMYPSMVSALFELTDNALDARVGKQVRVWVVVEQNTVTVIDSGSGMNPYLSTEEADSMRRYLDMIQEGTLPAGYDVRDELSNAGKRSLQFLAASIGLSGKTDPQQIGRHGVGFWGWLMFGDQAEVVTQTNTGDTATFKPPTRAAIKQGSLSARPFG